MEYIEVLGRTVDDALNNALKQLNTTSDMIEMEVIEKGSLGFFGKVGAKPAKIKVRKIQLSAEQIIKEFLSNMFGAMNMEVAITVDVDDDNNVNINLVGDDMGILIGKRGQTLDSIQYLVNLVVNRDSDKYYKIKVDTENYRERRKETLESLAKNIAYKVKRSRHSVALEPMNPYERRIIHSALQSDKFVTTKSEGEEPFRHVVVILKNPAPQSRYSGSKYGSSSYSGRNSSYSRQGGYNSKYHNSDYNKTESAESTDSETKVENSDNE